MATSNKQEFRIRDLCTRGVLLFPTGAQIIRDIKSIVLQPGPNQIVIDGLSPTVEPDSIKVEGSGAATISEVTIDHIPTKDVYEEVYPSDSEDEDEAVESGEETEDESITAITEKLKKLNYQLLEEKEKLASAAHRLGILSNFGNDVAEIRISAANIGNFLETYREERAKVFNDHKTAMSAGELIKEQIQIRTKEKAKLVGACLKAKEKSKKEKAKIIKKKLRQKAEVYKEKKRIKAERQSFWPKKTYRVTITIESTSTTPGSSRRASIDDNTMVDNNLSSTTFHEPLKVAAGEISLSLSYVTYSAFWSPRYDLSLDSVKCTGVLEYGADLINTTSETWRDCKVVLSTSQTAFSGLNEAIPILHPWNVRLQKGSNIGDGALFSIAETQAKRIQNSTATQAQKPRHLLFGVDSSVQDSWILEKANDLQRKRVAMSSNVENIVARTAPHTSSLFGASSAKPAFGVASRGGAFGAPSAAPVSGGLFGGLGASSAVPATGLFGAPSAVPATGGLFGAPSAAPVSGGLFGGFGASSAVPAPGGFGAPPGANEAMNNAMPMMLGQSARKSSTQLDVEAEKENSNDLDSAMSISKGFDFDEALAAAPNSLVFEAGKWSEEGLTTTYDVPGTKTLAPSNSTIKHKIAKISFTNIVFSHIIIGKLRQVAFLKAHLHNTSKITLLNGPLGLTLDSSFLGKATLPRCSSGEEFSLPLGVDPAIQILYPKPTVRRSQSGIFSKEDSNIFTRSIIITNTKHSSPAQLTVIDQVPVSEDEKLRIEITHPQGLKLGGDRVRTGVNATEKKQGPGRIVSGTGTAKAARASVHSVESGQEIGNKGSWGTAEATAKGKGGEVAWAVKLNPGCAVKLSLEYEMTFPGGDSIVNLW